VTVTGLLVQQASWKTFLEMCESLRLGPKASRNVENTDKNPRAALHAMMFHLTRYLVSANRE